MIFTSSPFGFREVTTDGIRILINGVQRNFWNWVEVSGKPSNTSEFLQQYFAENNRFYRFAHDSMLRKWMPAREDRLNFYDEHGIPGRLSTSIDGMFINYDLKNPLVWENFDEHLQQVARAYRNHPSNFMYSVENEIIFINAQNLGWLDVAEPALEKIVLNAKKIDPTLPYMGDGAGDVKSACARYSQLALSRSGQRQISRLGVYDGRRRE